MHYIFDGSNGAYAGVGPTLAVVGARGVSDQTPIQKGNYPQSWSAQILAEPHSGSSFLDIVGGRGMGEQRAHSRKNYPNSWSAQILSHEKPSSASAAATADAAYPVFKPLNPIRERSARFKAKLPITSKNLVELNKLCKLAEHEEIKLINEEPLAIESTVEFPYRWNPIYKTRYEIIIVDQNLRPKAKITEGRVAPLSDDEVTHTRLELYGTTPELEAQFQDLNMQLIEVQKREDDFSELCILDLIKQFKLENKKYEFRRSPPSTII